MESPLFSGKGPKLGYTNLYESLKLHRGSVFAPAEPYEGMDLALYFPGCGGSLFYDRIGLSSIMLLLVSGVAVAVPPVHLCCGVPLLAAGMDTEFDDNMAKNRQYLTSMLRDLGRQGFNCRWLVTSCGSCRDGLERLNLEESFPELVRQDITQLVLPRLLDNKTHEGRKFKVPRKMLYHAACHCEWANTHKIKSQKMLVNLLEQFGGTKFAISNGCCGESGMGAMTSPPIYNLLRERKKQNLKENLTAGCEGPIVVGCPSCKIGIARSLINLQDKRPVLHVAEWLAGCLDGEDRRQSFRKKANETKGNVRVVKMITPPEYKSRTLEEEDSSPAAEND